MNQPLVFVVVATYNPSEKYFKQQLDSIKNQDYGNFQVIIVDDNSENFGKKIIKELSDTHKIDTFYSLENIGPVKNFEQGIKLAMGSGAKYIALADQDDIWLSNKLSLLVKEIEEKNCDLVFSDLKPIDSGGKILSESVFELEKRRKLIGQLGNLFLRNVVTGCACLFSVGLLDKAFPFPEVKKFPPQFYHDQWLACIAFQNKGIHYIDQTLVLYRQHGGNLVGAGTQRKNGLARVFNILNKIKTISINQSFLEENLKKRLNIKKIPINILKLSFYEFRIWILWILGKFIK